MNRNSIGVSRNSDDANSDRCDVNRDFRNVESDLRNVSCNLRAKAALRGKLSCRLLAQWQTVLLPLVSLLPYYSVFLAPSNSLLAATELAGG